METLQKTRDDLERGKRSGDDVYFPNIFHPKGIVRLITILEDSHQINYTACIHNPVSKKTKGQTIYRNQNARLGCLLR